MTIRERIKKQKKHPNGMERKGFTLVELIVTLALITILLGAFVGGILTYQQYARYKKNNENARTIFNAAQAALTNYKVQGRLEKFQRQLNSLSEDSTLYYLMLDKGDGANIIRAAREGTATSGASVGLTGNAAAAFDFLRDYITDASIYDASICIEFDPQDGVVSGVLYCAQAGEFTYASESSDNVMSIVDRSESRRKKDSLGYYSAYLSGNAPNSKSKLTAKNVKLINGETLELQWTMADGMMREAGLIYTIDLKESDNSDTLVTLTIPAGEVSSLESTQSSKSVIDNVEVTLYNRSNSDDKVEFTAPFQVYYAQDSNNTVCITLDAIDIAAAKLVEAEMDAATAASDTLENTLKNTFSARRLSCTASGTTYGLDLNARTMIQASVSVSGGTYKPSDPVLSENSVNLLFAGYSSEDDTDVYKISNARHLFNIRAREALGDGLAVQYLLTEDITWGETDEENASATYENYYNATRKISKSSNVSLAFPSILELKADSTLTGKKAGAKEEESTAVTISGLVLRPEENTKNEESGTVWSDKVGLVQDNKGTISNLILENVQVIGAMDATDTVSGYRVNYVGAVCGYNEKTISDVKVTDGLVTGGINVGGMVGSNGSGASLENLENGAQVEGLQNVGGITGSATDSPITNCRNTGLVLGHVYHAENQQETMQNIGGIAGYATGTGTQMVIASCVSSQDFQAEVSQENRTDTALRSLAQGSCVGGIAGCLDGTASVMESYTEGGYVLGENAVGGIVGYRSGTGAVTAPSGDNAGRGNNAVVIGSRFAGGITGINGRIPEDISLENLTAESLEQKAGSLQDASSWSLVGWSNTGIVLAVSSGSENADRQTQAAYVGGIAGINGGLIKDCKVSSNWQGASASESGEIQSETLLASIAADAKNANYVGGFAGYNYGEITSTPAEGKSTAEITLQAAGADYVGGIVGYNGIAGKIGSYTLADSRITGKSYVGGMVGISMSNYNVTEEQIAVTTAITGENYVGGIAGQAGGTGGFYSCVNEGTVTATGKDTQSGQAAGILANRIRGNNGTEELKISSCVNEGTVTAAGANGQAAGILALTEYHMNALSVTDCVNVGNLNAATGAGICLVTDAESESEDSGMISTALIISNCRNYGYLVGSSLNFCGIYGSAVRQAYTLDDSAVTAWKMDQSVLILNCFGVAGDIVYPIAPPYSSDLEISETMKNVMESNYYFTSDTAGQGQNGIGLAVLFEEETVKTMFFDVNQEGNLSESDNSEFQKITANIQEINGDWYLRDTLSTENDNRWNFYQAIDSYLNSSGRFDLAVKAAELAEPVFEEDYTVQDDEATFYWDVASWTSLEDTDIQEYTTEIRYEVTINGTETELSAGEEDAIENSVTMNLTQWQGDSVTICVTKTVTLTRDSYSITRTKTGEKTYDLTLSFLQDDLEEEDADTLNSSSEEVEDWEISDGDFITPAAVDDDTLIGRAQTEQQMGGNAHA